MKTPLAVAALVGFFLTSPVLASAEDNARHAETEQRYYEVDQALPTTMLTRFVAGTGGVAAPTARIQYVHEEYYHWRSSGKSELCGGNYATEPAENHPIPQPTFPPYVGPGRPGPCYAPRPRGYPGARPGDGQRRRAVSDS
ncbi:hypothetical protein HIM_00718 [Hirsutella minnesotensis 3608]|nr:hypothetical protein HIM_00718 [Hirsutella minnesotensis 3608]